MKSGIVKRNAWGLAIATICLLTAAALAVAFYHRLVLANYWVSHTRDIIEVLHDISLDLDDIETSCLGYITSKQSSFLTLYRSGTIGLHNDMGKLIALVKDNAIQTKNADNLLGAATTQQMLIAQIIDSYRRGVSLPKQDWQSIYQTKSLIDQNRSIVSEMITIEHGLLDPRTKELKRSQMVILGVTVGLFVLSLATLISVFLTTRAYARAEEEHRKLLEKRVSDRTKELAALNDMLKRNEEMLTQRVKERTLELEQSNTMLEAARDKALAASALKSQFVATLSHELRTPMSGVLGMAELLLDTNVQGEAEEYAKRIFASASQLLSVLNDLLDFSRLEVGKVQLENNMFSVSALIKDVSTTVEALAMQKGLYLQHYIEDDVPALLSGDYGRNRQILLNLTHNALKFTNSGGVTINVKKLEDGPDGVLIKFSIIDTGIGIAPDVQLQLFQPFVQADGSTTRLYGGTGLGLSISKGLVELMSGKIGLRSEEGKGSEFWYTIPFGRVQSENESVPVRIEGTRTEGTRT